MTPKELLEKNNLKPRLVGEWYMIKCLFHKDNTPSMGVHHVRGNYNCFGCGEKGSWNKLHKILEGELPEQNALTLYNTPLPGKPQMRRMDPTISYFGNFKDPTTNPSIMQWLEKNGVLSKDFIKKYELSYVEYGEAISEELKLKKDQDYWTRIENRIVSPIYKKGNLINLECRTYLPNYKELDIPKVLYIKGGSTSWIYNWENIDLTKPVVVTESIKNFWKIWNVYPNVCAIFHALPSEEQLELLRQADTVIAFLDYDHGGLGGLNKQTNKPLKGMVHVLRDGLGKDFLVCYDRRVHPDGKGYDANDCTLLIIERHIKNAVWFSEWKKTSTDYLEVF